MLTKVDLTLEGRRKRNEKGNKDKRNKGRWRKERETKAKNKTQKLYEEIPMAARKRGNKDGHKHEGKKEGMNENKSSE